MTLALTFLAAALAAVPAHPRLLADANDFAAFKVRLGQSDLGRRGRERLLREADALLGFPPIEYRKDESGKRILHVSRAALNLIGKTAMAYRLTDDRRYAARAIREALNVAAFSDWNPSHFLDTAEMTFAAAICYDWLYDAMTDDERETVYRAILKKGLTDSKGEIPSGWWTRGGNNWHQVCNGGLVAGAIATAERNPELTRRIVDRTVECLPYAMKAFAPDGGFPEGPAAYWPYALEYNTMAIWAIEKFDGTDHGLCSLPGFAAEVEYLDSCTGPTGAPFNFSDAGIQSLMVRESDYPQWWFAKRFARPDTLVFFERNAFLRSLERPIPEGHAFRSYDRFFPFLLLCLDDVPADLAVKTPLRRVIGGENSIAVARTSWSDPDAWFVAMKGGYPAASHGHMDVGSFVLEANGVRWTHDLGNEVYSRIEASEIGARLWSFTQQSPRWTLFRYSTQGHGTLQFNDEPQNVGGNAGFTPFAAGEASETTLDLSALYGRDVRRTFALGPRGGLEVRDAIRQARAGDRVTWRVNVFADVEVKGNVAVLTAKDAAGRVRKLRVRAEPSDIVFTVTDRSAPARPYEAATPGLKQLGFVRTLPKSGEDRFSVFFENP